MDEIKLLFDNLFKYIEEQIDIPTFRLYLYDLYNSETKYKIDNFINQHVPLSVKSNKTFIDAISYYNIKNPQSTINDRKTLIEASKKLYQKELYDFLSQSAEKKELENDNEEKDDNEINKDNNNITEQEKDKKNIATNFKKYVQIILSEYGEIIPKPIKDRLMSINNYEDLVKIYDTGTISLFADPNTSKIHLPLGAYNAIKALSQNSEYGSDKTHQTHNEFNMIINNNTFRDFVEHVILKGETTLDYFNEILLHEVMHVCGSHGSEGLAEGFNELKTREIALKYNLETSCCGYPKETKIAYELQQLFGKDISDQLAFLNYNDRLNLLSTRISPDAAKLYSDVFVQIEQQFRPYMDKKYPGTTGIKDKCDNYDKINYSNIHQLINNYRISHQINTPVNINNFASPNQQTSYQNSSNQQTMEKQKVKTIGTYPVHNNMKNNNGFVSVKTMVIGFILSLVFLTAILFFITK